MSENKLNKLYELVIRKKDLKTSILNENGFNSEDIRSLCSMGAIEKIKRGEYKFKNVEDLFFYGLNLVNLGNREIGIACLEECLELEPSLLDIYLKSFLYSLKAKDYDTAYVFLESFYNHCPMSREYLFMLNFIKRAPITLEEEVARVKKIRKPLEQKKSVNSNSTHTLIIDYLNSLVEMQVDSKIKDGLNLAINREYLKFIELWKEIDEIRPFSYIKKIALDIAQTILEIQDTHEIPKRRSTSANTVYDAVKTNNFKRALNLSQDYLEKKGKAPNESVTNVLLIQIVDLIEKLEKERTDVKKRSSLYINHYRSMSHLVRSCLNRVYENGVALLEPLDEESREIIYEVVKTIPHVDAIELGEGKFKNVVLKLSYPQYIDVNQTMARARVLKDNWCNWLAIQKNLEILKSWRLTGGVCANLGILYLRLGYKRVAVEYLTIATIVYRNDGKQRDFSELICNIRKSESTDDGKLETVVKIEEFKEDNYFGIQSPQEKIDMVLCGEPAEVIRKSFNLDDDKLARVYIISARECYKEGNISEGDKLLRLAEKLPKAKETNKYLMEVRKNKKFYKIRNASSEVPVIKPVH